METIGRDLREMQRVPLGPEHVAAIRASGREVLYPAGTVIARPGDVVDRFVYVEAGEIEVVNPLSGERHVNATLGPTQFMGEISLLNGGAASLTLRAALDTRVVEVERTVMLRLMSEMPEMSDIIITVLTARRRLQLDLGYGSITLIGEDVDRDIRRIADFASRNRVPYVSHAVGSAEAMQVVASLPAAADRPAVIFGHEHVVVDPTPEKVARLLGLNVDLPEAAGYDVLIVGGGPAGVAAAVYAGSEGLRALVVEDVAIGGQAGASSRIENYMGFPTGISGADLVWRGEIQAMKFGSHFVMPRRVVGLDRLADGKLCATFDNGRSIRAGAVVVATGVDYRRLPVQNLSDYEGAGVYYAATENEARYCKGSDIVVIGGGNSAGQAAMYLSRAATHVRILVRGASLAASMSSYLARRLEANPGITIEYGCEVVALQGDKGLKSVTLRDVASGTTRAQAACALFVMVGAAPKTDWLPASVDLDPAGFVLTGDAVGASSSYATSLEGVFAVGDVRSGSIKRVASAVGEGSVVISKVWEYLNPA